MFWHISHFNFCSILIVHPVGLALAVLCSGYSGGATFPFDQQKVQKYQKFDSIQEASSLSLSLSFASFVCLELNVLTWIMCMNKNHRRWIWRSVGMWLTETEDQALWTVLSQTKCDAMFMVYNPQALYGVCHQGSRLLGDTCNAEGVLWQQGLCSP
jgi:hypothetical protein